MELTEFASQTLADRYFQPGDRSPEDIIHRAAEAFSDSPEMAIRIFTYLDRKWLSASTPILANAPRRISWSEYWDTNFDREHFEYVKALPISCYLNYVPDSIKGLTSHYEENAILSSRGGGIGGYWGDVRSDGSVTSGGSVSTGSIPFIHVVDSEMLAFNQGKTRRGSYAAYMDISHPEIIEFLEMRKPTGGDANRKCLNLHHGINIPDSFMELVKEAFDGADPDWNLVDPSSGMVVSSVKVRNLWKKILELRASTGEPYLHFIDTTNRALPETQKAKGLRVRQSNLCSEITLPTDESRTAVCCLSSLNLAKWDEWKDDIFFIPDVVRYLDNVIEYFIKNAKGIPKAVHSAMMERSIGIGALGFHDLLQSKNILFESALAVSLNMKIFKHIKEKAVYGSSVLAMERGESPDMVGTGLRNAHLLSIAPNASSSIIIGTSPSVEPWKANAFTHKTSSGSFLVKNQHLERLILNYGWKFTDDQQALEKWVKDQWQSITTNNGSVQHLEYLDEYEKDLFKTADEIDQRWIISHAADRQPFICQSQSINIFIKYGMHIKDFSYLHEAAWKQGLKTLYYCRSEPTRRAENVSSKVERMFLTEETCLACEG